MQFDLNAYSSRLARVRSILGPQEIEGVIIFDPFNIRYLTGFTGSDGVLIIRSQSSVLLVDGRYLTQAREEVRIADVHLYRDKLDGIKEALVLKAGERIGFEAAAVSFEFYLKMAERLKGEALKPLSEELNSLRAIKDAEEISCIRKAASIAANVLESVLVGLYPGLSEQDVAREIEFGARKAGVEKMAFETIVAFGPNAALPHATPGAKGLEQGDLIVIDYGVSLDGYCSDETCTFCLGFADDRKREVYNAVKEAHDRALEAIKSGVTCRLIDAAARSTLEKYGLAPYFSHGTGHGVGLEVHESPRISSRSDTVLAEGMVITIEPGVYLPGQWGIRIEDTVVVQNDGCEILTRMPKDLKIF